VKPNAGWLGLIKKVARDSLLRVTPEFLPGIGLCENVMRKALSHVPAIRLFCYTENDFHRRIMPLDATDDKTRTVQAND